MVALEAVATEDSEAHDDCFLSVLVPMEKPAGLKEGLLKSKEELEDGRGS